MEPTRPFGVRCWTEPSPRRRGRTALATGYRCIRVKVGPDAVSAAPRLLAKPLVQPLGRGPLPKIGAAASPATAERIGGKVIPPAIRRLSRDCPEAIVDNRPPQVWFQVIEAVRLCVLPVQIRVKRRTSPSSQEEPRGRRIGTHALMADRDPYASERHGHDFASVSTARRARRQGQPELVDHRQRSDGNDQVAQHATRPLRSCPRRRQPEHPHFHVPGRQLARQRGCWL